MTVEEKIDVLMRLHHKACAKYRKECLHHHDDCRNGEVKRLGDESQALWFAIQTIAEDYPSLHILVGDDGK